MLNYDEIAFRNRVFPTKLGKAVLFEEYLTEDFG